MGGQPPGTRPTLFDPIGKRERKPKRLLIFRTRAILSGSTGRRLSDAERPFKPRGCIAQAWSVVDVLRAWVKTA